MIAPPLARAKANEESKNFAQLKKRVGEAARSVKEKAREQRRSAVV
jgi:hypothetical protein